MSACKKCGNSTCSPRKTNARCVDYDGGLPASTSIERCDTVCLHCVLEDNSEIIDAIQEAISLEGLDIPCVGIVPTVEASIKDSIQKLGDKLCEVAEAIGLGGCEGCSTGNECTEEIQGSQVFVPYFDAWINSALLTGSNWIYLANSLSYSVNGGTGYYEIDLEVRAAYASTTAEMQAGFKIDSVFPTTISTGFDIVPLRQNYPNSVKFYMKLEQGQVIKPVFKQTAPGAITVSTVKMIVKKMPYYPG